MPLWTNIAVEISKNRIPEKFSSDDLMINPRNGTFVINGHPYRRGTLLTAPANYTIYPPGQAVINGQAPRFRRVAIGTYQLLDLVGTNHAEPIQQEQPPAQYTPPIASSNYEHKTDPLSETKNVFLEKSGGFVDWFTDSLNEFAGFQHSWRARSHRGKSGFPRDTLWSCTSLFSAYQQYVWPASVESTLKDYCWKGRSFTETTTYLEKLKKDLELAIINDNPDLTREICRNILRWGGVFSKQHIAADIKENMNADELARHIIESRNHLNQLMSAGFSEINLEFEDDQGNKMRLDSGTTKIYSLLCDSFIIYDGRVASALGMLVLLWWNGLSDLEKLEYGNEVPYTLRFSHCANVPTRKPHLSGEQWLDPLKVDNQRVKENIRSTWLIEESLERDRRKGGSASNFSLIDNENIAVRAVEAALFMVGYSIQRN